MADQNPPSPAPFPTTTSISSEAFSFHSVLVPGFHNPGMSLQLSAIKTLTGSNFDEWYESLSMFLGIMNLDLALRVNPPHIPTVESSFEDKKFYESWEHSNRNCLMIMQFTIEKPIRKSVPADCSNAKAFLDAIKQQYTRFDKA
ncbi:hypothetical protein ACOSQ4_013255 [Xanthoceras sorbifolium]